MRRLFLLLGALVVLPAGCSGRHYTVPSDQGTHFYLEAPGAATVQFASSLDAYALHAAGRVGVTTWEITVPPGEVEFMYFYVVDGKIFLPECPFHENDDFGSKNCIYRPGE